MMKKTLEVLCLDVFRKPLQDTLRLVLVKDGELSFILIGDFVIRFF